MSKDRCISCDVALPVEKIEKSYCWMCRDLLRQGAKTKQSPSIVVGYNFKKMKERGVGE